MKPVLLFTILAITLSSMQSQVTNQNFNEEGDKKDWSYSFTPYALLASQSTRVGGEQISQSFGELSSLTNAGFQFIASVRYKKFGLSVDGTFANLGTTTAEGALDLEVEVEQKIYDIVGSYSVYGTFEMDENRVIDGWSIDILGGAKYWSNGVLIDYSFSVGDTPIFEDTIEQPQDWWDLMIGVRTTISLSKRVLLSSWLKFGGFGIGNSAKIAHDFVYLNAFRVSKLITINAGFRNFRYRRVDGEGDAELETKVNVLGPFLGLSFIFN